MSSTYHISSYCRVKNGRIILNQKEVFADTSATDFSVFIKNAYKTLDVSYSKFFKMDQLSKLGFLAADLILSDAGVSPEDPENIALVMSNKASSLDTDRKHQDSINSAESYYPSPAIFVYTLPNILMGEISIKHKLFTENSFFIFEAFNPEHLFTYASILLETSKADNVLCGWVDVDNNSYDALLYMVTKEGTTPHTIKNITDLY